MASQISLVGNRRRLDAFMIIAAPKQRTAERSFHGLSRRRANIRRERGGRGRFGQTTIASRVLLTRKIGAAPEKDGEINQMGLDYIDAGSVVESAKWRRDAPYVTTDAEARVTSALSSAACACLLGGAGGRL